MGRARAAEAFLDCPQPIELVAIRRVGKRRAEQGKHQKVDEVFHVVLALKCR